MNTVVALALLAAAVLAKPHHKPATSGWTAPATYTTDVIISRAFLKKAFDFYKFEPNRSSKPVPYADISEPAKIYFDSTNSRSRIDYYGGQDSYIYRADLAPAGKFIIYII